MLACWVTRNEQRRAVIRASSALRTIFVAVTIVSALSAAILAAVTVSGCGASLAGLSARVELRVVGDSAICAFATVGGSNGSTVFELPAACYTFTTPPAPRAFTWSDSTTTPRPAVTVRVGGPDPVVIRSVGFLRERQRVGDTVSPGRVYGPP